jgi:hypothetical protein
MSNQTFIPTWVPVLLFYTLKLIYFLEPEISGHNALGVPPTLNKKNTRVVEIPTTFKRIRWKSACVKTSSAVALFYLMVLQQTVFSL